MATKKLNVVSFKLLNNRPDSLLNPLISVLKLCNNSGSSLTGGNERYAGINFWQGSDGIKVIFIN